jgi:prenylcysteine oxidase/farnesylcysteine lyase
VVGGNKQIPEKALSWANATFHHSEVLNITRVQQSNSLSPKYTITYQDVAGSSLGDEGREDTATTEQFDAIIFANPLPISRVAFTDFPQPVYTPATTTPYHRTVATFVKGEVDPSFFGLKAYGKDFPFNIMTTASTPDEISFPLCCISLLIPSDATADTVAQYVKPVEQQPNRVWKLFSTRPLTQEELDQIFSKRGEAVAIDWLAYPEYNPPEQFPSFVLDDGVFYINAIEKSASAMEMSAVGAMNCSLLTWKYLSQL